LSRDGDSGFDRVARTQITCVPVARIQLCAMNFFLDPHGTALRFADYIEALRDIFRYYRLDFGSPQDFVAFAQTVKHQSELRSDVIRVVKALRESEPNISFRIVLTVIAVASGGPDVAMSDQNISVSVQLIVESLNRDDPCSQQDADHPDSSKSNLIVMKKNAVAAPVQATPDKEKIERRDASVHTYMEKPFSDIPGVNFFVVAATLMFTAFLWMFGHVGNSDGPNSLSGTSPTARDASVSIKEPQLTKTSEGIGSSGVSNSEDTPSPTPKRKPATIPFRSQARPSLSHTVSAETEPVMSSKTSGIVAPSDGLSSEPVEHRPLDVSSDVMAANLISGPKPTYPILANLTHMQGSVLMQAVISRNGTVERVHVIKGHRLLRSAAKSAVQSWRYRPYEINGRPVEVATVVSVDFFRHR
jgi:TonB family protein